MAFMTCGKCQISKSCSRKGSSPLRRQDKNYLCEIVGGYSTQEVERHRLKPRHAQLHDDGFKYATIAKIPTEHSNGMIAPETVIIMHARLSHIREKSSMITLCDLYPKNSV